MSYEARFVLHVSTITHYTVTHMSLRPLMSYEARFVLHVSTITHYIVGCIKFSTLRYQSDNSVLYFMDHSLEHHARCPE